jgi:HSP20 family protein
MLFRKEGILARPDLVADPFAFFDRMRTGFDRIFGEPFWPALRMPTLRAIAPETPTFSPAIEVFEKDGRLLTKVDLPGLKKEDVKVEVIDGFLTISGERKLEKEEKKENIYRSEREYGAFYRAIPLPADVKYEDVKATFADGVLEVTVPLPIKPEMKVHEVEVQTPAKAVKPAA